MSESVKRAKVIGFVYGLNVGFILMAFAVLVELFMVKLS
jgi:tetrahydromethanopterin S-methyltransferase subunit G